VRIERLGNSVWAFVASPLRAITDLVYLRPAVSWGSEGLSFLTGSLRIEEEDLQRIRLQDFDEILVSMRSQRVLGYLEGLRRELTR
jgi:hypothetical protein